jgi:two-component system copper resistance phosphate regulon response regulator CusR
MAVLLVFDDDPVAREAICAMLECGGHQVIAGQCGADAGRQALALSYDLLVTDLIMPDVDGWDLIRLLRANRPRTPILAISAGSSAIPQQAALRLGEGLGADVVLAKPVTKAELLATIQRLLMRSRQPATDAAGS